MDSLALLCNLYGDGPQTLRRLREAGCGTLASLESIECERLASLLRTSVRAARRFQSEGRLLRERSEPSVESSSQRKSGDELASRKAVAPSPLLTPVLDAWRERDARAGSDVRALGDTATLARTTQPEEGPRVQGAPLEVLEGMDAELIASLRTVGVGSLLDLCNADVLDLAGRGVAGYTRLLRVQFLARRRMGANGERRAGAGGVGLPVEGAPLPSVSAATSQSATGARSTGADALTATDEKRSVEPDSALRTAASATLLESDVVIPHPPPERRRADRAQTATSAGETARFSPGADPHAPAEPTLQSDLERYALERGSAPEGSPTVTALEEEGSSGPFA